MSCARSPRFAACMTSAIVEPRNCCGSTDLMRPLQFAEAKFCTLVPRSSLAKPPTSLTLGRDLRDSPEPPDGHVSPLPPPPPPLALPSVHYPPSEFPAGTRGWLGLNRLRTSERRNCRSSSRARVKASRTALHSRSCDVDNPIKQSTQNMYYFLEQKENIVKLAANAASRGEPTFSGERQITKS